MPIFWEPERLIVSALLRLLPPCRTALVCAHFGSRREHGRAD